ncbi:MULTISPECIES: serine/threonine-protein kinase [Nocardia]|uniref:serine/threonine-protein kinase n=1 Tax=Nocardia TaxID=1817 RepID=UPI0018941184|nr:MULTISPECIES: serine/threonine-protein kinase [Nocardia]MBF6350796.1 serine/threonine protein kinase [Nocardia flavorosea]
MLQPGEDFAGYLIRRRLGVGGMGMVFLARHPRLPRLVALKLLNPDLYSDTEIRLRFERESELAGRLEHPNIVTVYDRGAEGKQLWISMQYVPGSDASLVDLQVLDPRRAVQIIGDTGVALDFAHANGVLHRDVKPGNILLAKPPIGQPERVLLTDFGIAGVRDAETTLAAADTITATLAYAAPEQLTGAKLDHRGDQYSLACTLFWLLTGSGPYPGTNPAELIQAHLTAPVPRLSRIRPGLPPALDEVLARALAKNPAERFLSCAEFAAAARSALRPPGPRGGRPPGPGVRLRPGPRYGPGGPGYGSGEFGQPGGRGVPPYRSTEYRRAGVVPPGYASSEYRHPGPAVPPYGSSEFRHPHGGGPRPGGAGHRPPPNAGEPPPAPNEFRPPGSGTRGPGDLPRPAGRPPRAEPADPAVIDLPGLRRRPGSDPPDMGAPPPRPGATP